MEEKFNPNENYDVPVLHPMRIGVGKIIAMIVLVCMFLGTWFLYNELYIAEAQSIDEVDFTVEKNETIDQLAKRLDEANIIRNQWLFKKYLVWKGIDKKVQSGNFQVIYPITLARVATSLKMAVYQGEKTITILPGWDLRDIADYFVTKEIIFDKEELFNLVGEPAVLYSNISAPKLSYDFKLFYDKPNNVSYEGYLAPDTYRVFDDATLEDVIRKLANQQNKLFTDKMYADIKSQGRTVHEILTMASILEREVRTAGEKAKVADLFWRRYENKWALQADSTVHYAVNKKGDLFTTKEDRDSNNLWNTYQYPSLPPGPISAPGLDSIKAAIYPEANNYWYFLTSLDGEVKYGVDLDEHNRNVQKYLR
jgi:UPF0755 protein